MTFRVWMIPAAQIADPTRPTLAEITENAVEITGVTGWFE